MWFELLCLPIVRYKESGIHTNNNTESRIYTSYSIESVVNRDMHFLVWQVEVLVYDLMPGF